jgi:hypothetical protein
LYPRLTGPATAKHSIRRQIEKYGQFFTLPFDHAHPDVPWSTHVLGDRRTQFTGRNSPWLARTFLAALGKKT